MIGEIAAAAIIPFGIGELCRQRGMVQCFGRQVQIEAEAGGGPSLSFTQRHVVQFVGCAAVGIVAVVPGTVDIDHLRHGEDFFETVEDEGAAFGLAVLCLFAHGDMAGRFRALRCCIGGRLVLALPGLGCFAQQRVRPERNRQHRQITRRRFG